MEHSPLECRGVRFDDECILIPDPQPRSRMPRLLINPFTFKRRHSQDSYSPTSYHCDAPPSPTSTFPRPALSRKSSLNEGPPLSPPPIHRHASLPPTPTTSARPRAPSLPPLQRSERDRVTIPLRPCCPDCFSATERATLLGEKWTEKFSRAARRRRSASADNYSCPPHVHSGNQATIQWSSNITEDSAPAAFHPILVVDEADHKASPVTKPSPAPDGEQELTDALNAIDRLSVQDPEDGILPPLLTRQKPWLSPIPSNNASLDDVSREPSTVAAEGVGDLPLYLPVQVSPPPSPLPQTPPSVYSSPVASPKISSPSPSERESPRIGSSFRIPKGASLVRAGADILRGVSVIGTSPV
ncbi:hypothetical protein EDB86DRAFT_2876852 [Lactarius hatsudake]|nr:hypothetical protein EDB86DRAFT_2876852 [Lactarius hatsudake]